MAEFMGQHIPNAAKVVMSGVGHMSNMEAPEEVTEAVSAFLAEL